MTLETYTETQLRMIGQYNMTEEELSAINNNLEFSRLVRNKWRVVAYHKDPEKYKASTKKFFATHPEYRLKHNAKMKQKYHEKRAEEKRLMQLKIEKNGN